MSILQWKFQPKTPGDSKHEFLHSEMIYKALISGTTWTDVDQAGWQRSMALVCSFLLTVNQAQLTPATDAMPHLSRHTCNDCHTEHACCMCPSETNALELPNKLSNMMPNGIIYEVLDMAYIPTTWNETLTHHVARVCMANGRSHERAYQA